MPWSIVLAVAVIMLGLGTAMMVWEYVRNRAKRPLFKKETVAIPYWLLYLSLLVLGGTLALRAAIEIFAAV